MGIKPLHGLLIAFICSLVIYAVIKNDVLDFSFSKFLSFINSDEINKSIEKICSKSSPDLVEFYRTQGPYYKAKLVDGEGTEFFRSISENLFLGKEVDWPSQIIKFFSQNRSLILIFVLIIILFLFWWPFVCCVCCKLCICFPRSITKHHRFFSILCLVLCLAILIISFIGFTDNSSIVQGIFGFGCSFLKLIHHIINGDDYKVKPYWSGILPIASKLDVTMSNITKLESIVSETNDNINNLRKTFFSFYLNLKSDYEKKENYTILSPEPDGEAFVPNYIRLYGPSIINTTVLGTIQTELKLFDDISFGFFSNLIKVISLPNDTIKVLNESLKSFVNSLDKSKNDIDKVIGVNIDKATDYFVKADNYGRTGMNSLFIINIFWIIAIIISLIVIFLCKTHCLLCFSWCCLYLTKIFSLFAGLTFLLIGAFLQNFSLGVLAFIEDISQSKTSGPFAEIIDCCFNGDGLLYKSNIFPKKLDIEIIDNIYSLEKKLNENIINLNNYTFKSLIAAEDKYQTFKNNLTESLPQLQDSIDKIHKYIDIDATDSKVDTSTPIKDLWVIDKKDCNEYQYESPETNNLLTETTKSCLVITEWTSDKIKERYKLIQSTDTEFNVGEETVKYYNSITGCLNDHIENVDDMLANNVNYNKAFNDFRNNSIQILKNVIRFMKPFREDFNEIIGNGEGSIFRILNCNFMKRDFNKLFEEIYNGFGRSFKSSSTKLIIICFLEIILTILLVIVIDGERNDDKNNIYNVKGTEIVLTELKEQPLTD